MALAPAFVTAALSGVFGLAGGRILDRMSDVNFKRWIRWIVTVMGAVYLVQAAVLFVHGG